MSSPCSTELLEQFLTGSLAAAEESTLHGHLRGCESCCRWLDSHSDNPQLLTWKQGLARLEESTPSGPALEHMLSVLRFGYAEPVQGTEPRMPPRPVLEPPAVTGDLGQIGPYRILAELGRGGMGIVYRGLDGGLGRTVAIKVLRPELADGPAQARLVREARLAARFRHEHAVGVHAVAQTPDGLPYLVLEFVDGQSLSRLLRERRRLEPAEAVDLLVPVADALASAHAAGLVHRDVKPSNILIERGSSRARLTDFGLARAETQKDTLTPDGALLGTPVYMSPEQAAARPTDARTDVYGLGVTLYEVLTGDVPFHGTPLMVVRQLLQDEPRPPRRLHEGIPRDLETICLKAMAREPGRRYATAAALRDDLGRWRAGLPIHARPPGRLEQALRWGRRRPLVAALLLTIALGVAGITWKGAEAVQLRQQAEASRDEAARQRQHAEQNLRQALDVVDAYLTRVSDNPTLKAGNFEPLRRELLLTARNFYAQFVAENPDNPDLLAELGRAYGRLGLITAQLESRGEALRYFEKMRDIFERLHREQSDNPRYQDQLAESCLQEGSCYRVVNQTGKAREDYERCRALRTELVNAHPEDAGYRFGLTQLLLRLGNMHVFVTNSYDDADRTLREARQLYQGLPTGPDAPPEYRCGFADTLLLLGMLHGLIDEPGLQIEYCREAAAQFESLTRSCPEEASYLLGLLNSSSELGFGYLRLGRIDEAEKTWRHSLELGEQLRTQHPACSYYRHVVADGHYNLAVLLFHERGRREAAHSELEQTLAVEEPLTLEYPDVGEYTFCVCNALRDLCNQYGEIGSAQSWGEAYANKVRAAHPDGAPADLGSLRDTLATFEERVAAPPATPPDQAARDAYAVAVSAADQQEARARDHAINGNEAWGVALNHARAATAALRAGLPASVADAQCARAVAWLEQAYTRHHFSAVGTYYSLFDERLLSPLRGREDFQRLANRMKHDRQATQAASREKPGQD